jgi:hypothetical protein
MRITVVSAIGIYPERLNGPAINAYNLARSLAELGNDVSVVAGTANADELSESLTQEPFETHPLPKKWGGTTSRYEFRRSL